MGTIHFHGVHFWIIPQDHLPVHAHARYAETLAKIVFRSDRTIAVEAVTPANPKRSDIRRIRDAARACYDLVIVVWERMNEED